MGWAASRDAPIAPAEHARKSQCERSEGHDDHRHEGDRGDRDDRASEELDERVIGLSVKSETSAVAAFVRGTCWVTSVASAIAGRQQRMALRSAPLMRRNLAPARPGFCHRDTNW
jgi:hypothetical protein